MPALASVLVNAVKKELIARGLQALKFLLFVVLGGMVMLSGCGVMAGGGLLVLTGAGAAGGGSVGVDGAGNIVFLPPAAGLPVSGDSAASIAFAAAAAAPCSITGGLIQAVGSIEDSSFGTRHAIGAAILLSPSGKTIHAYGPAQFLIDTWNTYGDQPLAVNFVGSQEQPPSADAFIWQPAHAYPALARYLCALGVARDPVSALWAYSGCVPGPGCNRFDHYAFDALARARGYDAGGAPPVLATTDPARDTLLANARSWLGVKYVFGGCSASGVDCSCYVQIMYRSVGVGLPRTAQQQWDAVQHVSTPVPGDLAFFRQTYFDPTVTVTHVGIVTRVDPNGVVWMIDAPGARAANDPPDFPAGRVREEAIAGFWAQHIMGYGRALPVVQQPPNAA